MAEFFTNVSNFFSWISETIVAFFDYFLSFLDSLLLGLGLASSALSWAVGIVAYVPAVVGGCAVAAITVYVIKFILGR